MGFASRSTPLVAGSTSNETVFSANPLNEVPERGDMPRHSRESIKIDFRVFCPVENLIWSP